MAHKKFQTWCVARCLSRSFVLPVIYSSLRHHYDMLFYNSKSCSRVACLVGTPVNICVGSYNLKMLAHRAQDNNLSIRYRLWHAHQAVRHKRERERREEREKEWGGGGGGHDPWLDYQSEPWLAYPGIVPARAYLRLRVRGLTLIHC